MTALEDALLGVTLGVGLQQDHPRGFAGELGCQVGGNGLIEVARKLMSLGLFAPSALDAQ